MNLLTSFISLFSGIFIALMLIFNDLDSKHLSFEVVKENFKVYSKILVMVFLLSIVSLFITYNIQSDLLVYEMIFELVITISTAYLFFKHRDRYFKELRNDLFFDKKGKYLMKNKKSRMPL